MACCGLLLLLMLPLLRVSSEVPISIPFRGNTRAYLQVLWILQSDDGDTRNVSVRHRTLARSTPQVLWHVNDVIVSESSPGFVLSDTQFRHENIHNTQTVSVTSLRIPASVVVNKLQLQLTMDVNDVVLNINLPHLDEGTSRLEYVPTYSLNMDHAEHIQYEVDEPVKILTTFDSEMLNESTWMKTTAEFISINNCLTPLGVDVKKPRQNQDFIRLTTPTESELSWQMRSKLRNPNNKLKYIHFPSTSEGFWGLLKVTSGFATHDACDLFGGVKITRTAFLRPPTHGDFFTNNATVFLNPKSEFKVDRGQNLDVIISAIGGSEKEWTRNPEKEYPTVKLYKNQLQVDGDERIDVLRLFQREVIFRFRNVTEGQAGSYLVKATSGQGEAWQNFNIIVKAVC